MLTCDAWLATCRHFQEYKTKTLGIPVNITVGHGENITCIVPAGQIFVAHVTEKMHTIKDTKFLRQTTQMIKIITDANQGIFHVHPLLPKIRQGSNNIVKTFSPLQAAHRQNKLFPFRKADRATQVTTRQSRTKPLLVYCGIDQCNALWFDTDQANQDVTGVVAVGKDPVSTAQDIAHCLEFLSPAPTCQFFPMCIDQHRASG